MKIWFPVIKGGSGADIYTRRLADALVRRGIEAEITWFPSSYQTVPFFLRGARPPPQTTLIHANSWNGFAFERDGIPLIVTEHLPVFDPAYIPYKTLAQRFFHDTVIRWYEKASMRAAAAVTTVSQAAARSLAAHLRVERALVIPNWVNTSTFHPGDGARRPGPFRLLFVGNLTRRKGVDLLRPIMADLGEGFELRFTAGLRTAGVLGDAANIIPLGRLDGDAELLRAYHGCDALLFPSRFEGLPQAPLEAMACGKPVVAANASSLPEVVEHERTGLLCPPDDVSAFLAACRALAGSPDLTRSYGGAGRRRAEVCFSEERIIPLYLDLYGKLS